MTRKLIGVFPASAANERARLFRALEAIFPVRFEGREPGQRTGLDAAMVLPGAVDPSGERPDVPTLIAFDDEDAHAQTRKRVDLSETASLDTRLRGHRVTEHTLGRLPQIPSERGVEVLASCEGVPVFAYRPGRRAPTHLVSVAPRELTAMECLRDRLREGRFLALLAWVHFLREVAGASLWRPPPLRAAFIFDDPNLHSTSYGYLNFPELARHAAAHDYHLAFAMVPLDAWFAHPVSARLFRENTHRLSLLIHGNNHVKRELAEPLSEPDRRALLAQALRRVADFERRTAISVSRVMTPPHGACSREMMETMLLAGLEAICISRSFPWLSRVPPGRPLTGWEIGDVAGGFPVLLRYGLSKPRAELVFRAFLDQPLLLYGHHQDLASGPELLEEAAAMINGFGGVTWTSLSAIAKSNFAVRRTDETFAVRLFTRRAQVEVPEGIRYLVLEASGDPERAARARVLCRDPSGTVSATLSERLPVSSPGTVEISLVSSESFDLSEVANPSWQAWPILRKTAMEARDRLLPIVHRIGRGRSRYSAPA